MCISKLINHYPAKSALYKFYKEHIEVMYEDLYEPFYQIVKGTNLEKDFDKWWQYAEPESILKLFDFCGLVSINLTEKEVNDIQIEFDEKLTVNEYLKEVFLRGWFDVQINPHNFFRYFTKISIVC